MSPSSGSHRKSGTIVAIAFAIVVALSVLAPVASAATRVDDPCGLGATGRSGAIDPYPEPQLGWLDMCSVEVAGVAGAGHLRAVSADIHLAGDVDSGAGAKYTAGFKTERCSVHQEYRIYPVTQESRSYVHGYCDPHKVPCDFPESEVESRYPNYSCGDVGGEFELHDSPAVSVTMAGTSVTFVFDPNKLPSGALPGALAEELAPRQSAPDSPPHYGSLAYAWVGAAWHTGVNRVLSTSGGYGEDTLFTGAVPLD